MRRWGFVVKVLGQTLAVVAWVLTVVLVAMQYGLIWAALNFFIPPLSIIGSCFVWVWPLYLIGIPLYFWGTQREERKAEKDLNAALRAMNSVLAGAVVRVPMNGITFFSAEYGGPGTFYGFGDGRFIVESARTGSRLQLSASDIEKWGSGNISPDGPADAGQRIVFATNVLGAPNVQVIPPDVALLLAWLERFAPLAAIVVGNDHKSAR